jgi:hypothetical protein
MSCSLVNLFVVANPLPEHLAEATAFPPEIALAEVPRPEPPCFCAGFWSYDRWRQEEAVEVAADLGIPLRVCERPEELGGCGLVILDLDFLHAWGDAGSAFRAAVAVVGAGGGGTVVGLSRHGEHGVADHLPLFSTLREALLAVSEWPFSPNCGLSE